MRWVVVGDQGCSLRRLSVYGFSFPGTCSNLKVFHLVVWWRFLFSSVLLEPSVSLIDRQEERASRVFEAARTCWI